MIQFSKIARRMAVVLGLVAASSGAWAQSSATGTANATATVIAPIAVTAPVDLAFGKVVPGAALGTLTLTAASPTVASHTGGVTQPGTQAGTVTAARFDVTGEAGFTYSITLPSSASSLTGSVSGTMSVDTFTSSLGASGTLSGAGAQSFFVGGTLHVGALQAAGTYTGTFDVTVAYN